MFHVHQMLRRSYIANRSVAENDFNHPEFSIRLCETRHSFKQLFVHKNYLLPGPHQKVALVLSRNLGRGRAHNFGIPMALWPFMGIGGGGSAFKRFSTSSTFSPRSSPSSKVRRSMSRIARNLISATARSIRFRLRSVPASIRNSNSLAIVAFLYASS